MKHKHIPLSQHSPDRQTDTPIQLRKIGAKIKYCGWQYNISTRSDCDWILMATYSRTRRFLGHKTEQSRCCHSVSHLQVTQLHFFVTQCWRNFELYVTGQGTGRDETVRQRLEIFIFSEGSITGLGPIQLRIQRVPASFPEHRQLTSI